MKSIKNFEGSKVENMSSINGGGRVLTNGAYKDKKKKNGEFITRVGWFDGPRD